MTYFQFGYFILILVLMDLIILRTLRKLLRDFLRSKKNKWEMYQLYASQSFKSRLLLDYIYQHLKKNQKPFIKFHRFYLFYLVAIVPQYIVIVLTYCLLHQTSIFTWVLLAIKVIVYFVIRSYFDGNMVSIYRK